MWNSHDYDRRAGLELDFYLPRFLGGKLAVFVALLLLYLCISYQLAKHMNPIAVDLGVAHAQAAAMLAVFGGADTIVTITIGHKDYDLTRHMVAHSHMFIACWRAVLWQIECGTILACGLTFAPPVLWQAIVVLSDLGSPPLPKPRRAEPELQALATYYVAAPAPPPVVSLWPSHKTLEEAHRTVDQDAADSLASPSPEVRKRPRNAKKISPPEEETTPPPTPPSPPIMEPGQVRKRHKPEV